MPDNVYTSTKHQRSDDYETWSRQELIAELRRRDQQAPHLLSFSEPPASSINHSSESTTSEEHFRELFNNMNSGVAVYQPIDNGADFRIKDINRMATIISNVKREDVIDRPVTEVFPGVKDFGLFAVFQRVYQTGIPEMLPVTQYKDQRMSYWVENNVYRLSSGEIVAVYNDLTATKQAEEALAQSREQYELAVNGTNDGIWDWDIKNDKVYFSPSWKRMIGYAPDELVDSFETFKSLLHRDDRKRVLDFIKDYFSKTDQTYAIEFRFRHKDGSYRWILARGAALRDANGTPYRMAGSHSDITDRKEAEARIEQALENTQKILDAMPYGVVIVDTNNHIKNANDAALKLLGQSRDHLVGSHCHKSICPHPDDTCFMTSEQATLTHTEHELLNASGQFINVLKNTIPLTLNGEDVLLEAFVDITELKATQNELDQARLEAERANKAKSEFLANISHEIRTPLHAVIGFGELLHGSVEDAKSKCYLEAITSSARSLSQLINDILDLSKIEANRMTLKNDAMDPRLIFRDLENIFQNKLQEKHLYYTCHFSPDFPGALFLDETRFRQVFLNLIGNAIKFTEQGHVKISVEHQYLDDTQERSDITVTVEDTGMGITEDQLEAIFVPFQQQPGQSQSIDGTGLGLSISKRLVEMMNGTINAKSKPGQGSQFTVCLHDVAVHKAKSIARTKPHISGIQFQRKRVLVVEDTSSNRLLLCEILKQFGLSTIEAEDGYQALYMVHESTPDLILMDIQMPQLNGYETTEALKSNPRLCHIPIIALSATTEESPHQFDAFIPKPITIEKLIDALSKFIARKTPIPNADTPNIKVTSQVDIPDLSNMASPKTLRASCVKIKETTEELQYVFVVEAARALEKTLIDLTDSYPALTRCSELTNELSDSIETFDVKQAQNVFKNISALMDDYLNQLDQS